MRTSYFVAAVIANAGSLSPAVPIGQVVNGAIEIITPFTSAAAITFQGSHSKDGSGPFYDIYDETTTPGTWAEVVIPSHATHTGRSYELPAAVMNFRFIKIRSGISGAAVAQSPGAAGTTVMIVAKD